MAYRVLIPQDISDGGKNYLKERGYDITVHGKNGQIDLETVGEYDAILLRTAIVDRKVLDAAGKLKVIGRYGVGTDNIDLEACREKGISVTNAPYGNILSVAEYTMLMLLQCAKNTHEVEQLWRCPENDFNTRNTHCGVELAGKCLGIVGTGRIGSLVAKKAKYGFDMEIIGYDPYLSEQKQSPDVTYCSSLHDLLKIADFVTCHVPLNEETYHLIGEAEFRLMKSTAFLINASRGGVIDEEALHKALIEKKIAGAALDVFEHEPKVWPNPLFELPNVVVSPHTAGMTKESSDRVGIHAAMGIDAVLSGRMPEWTV